jgi:inhibitor of KinA sporulation pathway (predicted exonuclease)
VTNLMALDMEYNQPSKSIIQIGVVIGNINSGAVFKKSSWLVHTCEPITPFIEKLTGISNYDLDQHGLSLQEVYQNLCILHKECFCFRNPVTWGGGDSEDLRHALHLDEDQFIFGRRWIDAKTLFISRQIMKKLPTQAGLAKAMTKLGLTFKGTKHNAEDDAYNTFVIYHKLINEFK